MVERGIYDGATPPVWAWQSCGGRNKRPDLRKWYGRCETDPYCRVELDAPRALVLLSEFDAWHTVLMQQYLTLTQAEFDRIWELEKAGKVTRQMIEASWKRVFDVEAGDPDWWGVVAERDIQACLPYIDLSWVGQIDRFRGSRSRKNRSQCAVGQRRAARVTHIAK
jgi:hypothetical protein